MKDVTIHETVFIDDPVTIGSGTKVWHFCHISKGAEIGESCILGQNVYIANNVKIGSRVKVQNNVSIYTGCKLEDEVFLGPGCVLTNVTNPRSQVDRHSIYEKTLFKRGCTIGANATVVCGITIGRYAFIGAGCLVAKDVPDYALMVGNPARRIGWMSRHGHRLTNADENGIMICPESGFRYRIQDARGNGKGMDVLKCLDLDEEEPLPEGLDVGKRTYDEFK